MGASWISYAELAGLIGEDAAQALCSTRGGVTLYVPKLMDENGEIAKIIGVASLHKLAQVYGGEMIAVPNRRKAGPRKGEVLELLERGLGPREVALALDVTQRYVEYLAKAARPRNSQAKLPGF